MTLECDLIRLRVVTSQCVRLGDVTSQCVRLRIVASVCVRLEVVTRVLDWGCNLSVWSTGGQTSHTYEEQIASLAF